jgi:hypothetical protein
MAISILLALLIGLSTCWYFFISLNNKVSFKELFLMLYVINYLLSPAIIYLIPEEYVYYKMRISPDKYFYISSIGLLGILIGVNLIKNPLLFKPNIKLIQLESAMNKKVLQSWLYSGIVLSLIAGSFPTEIAFLIYLLSLIRFIGAFGLYSLNPTDNWKYVLGVLVYEFIVSLRYGMFHDFVMWTVFFIIYYLYLKKITNLKKVSLMILAFISISFIQNSKATYREALGRQEVAGLNTFIKSSKLIQNNNQTNNILYSDNFINSITRINQGWIFASVIDNMDRYRNFQGLTVLKEYAKAALLPRIFAPDKIRAGDKKIFNQFSGTLINDNTSMGIGILGDGYVAYGEFGVFIFGLFFGLCFAIVFKIVSGWTKVSPFFFLFIFPILNYAVRPDCELQTILGHMVKSILIFSLVVRYYKGFFQKKLFYLQKASTV